jgi:uncharacterized protein YkwD
LHAHGPRCDARRHARPIAGREDGEADPSRTRVRLPMRMPGGLRDHAEGPGMAGRADGGRNRHPKPPAPPPVPTPPPPTGKPDPAPLGDGLFAAINAARSSARLAPLARHAGLDATASGWAAQIARAGRLDHGDFAGRIAAVRPGVEAGETIGEGYPDGTSEVAGWIKDPPHRAILLGDYRVVGVGVAVGRGGSLWWVADFAG